MSTSVTSAAPIGLSNLTLWPLLTDPVGGSPTYGSPITLSGAAEANRDPAASQTPYYADNKLYALGTTKGFQKISIKLFYIDPAIKAQILGETYANGQTVGSSLDTPPYFAVAYKILLNDGNFIYRVLYKTQFMKDKTDNKTKADKITFVEVNLDGAVATLASLGYDALEQYSDDTAGSSTALTNWFTTPQFPSSDNAALTTVATATGSGGASTGTLTLTFSKGDSSSFALNNTTVTTTSVVVEVESTGASVPGTFTTLPSAPGTTQVVVFTPTTPWTAAEKINVQVTAEIKDNSGIACTPYFSQITVPA